MDRITYIKFPITIKSKNAICDKSKFFLIRLKHIQAGKYSIFS